MAQGMAGAPITEARKLRIAHWNVDGKIHFPVDPEAIARNLGIAVHVQAMDADTAGFIIREAGGPTEIYLNAHDAPVRRRFTLAHELGHFVQQQDSPEIGFVDRRDEIAASGSDRSEVWANRFAAELLMPAAVVSKWWAEGKSAEDIRKRMNVSAPAIAYRLRNLGLSA